MEDWHSFVEWATKGALGFVCVYGVHILSQMKSSIDSLNNKMGEIMVKNEYAFRDIEKLDARIVRLEAKDAVHAHPHAKH